MSPLATIGNLIEVTPGDDVQHWLDANADCLSVDDRTPFRFRVVGELIDNGVFFGLFGTVESGPERYLGLICNIMFRLSDSDWRIVSKSAAGFKVGPSISKRVTSYDPVQNSDIPFFYHPEGTSLEGFPQLSRYGGVEVV